MVDWISLYQAKGMASLAYVFQFAKSRNKGWESQGLIILAPGHHLSIFSDSDQMLWSG